MGQDSPRDATQPSTTAAARPYEPPRVERLGSLRDILLQGKTLIGGDGQSPRGRP